RAWDISGGKRGELWTIAPPKHRATQVNDPHSSRHEPRLTAVSTTKASPSKGVRDAETARSQRQFSARPIHRFGLMSGILVGGLGFGFLLGEGAALQAAAGSAVLMPARLPACTVF